MARPTRLTESIKTAILQGVEAGLSLPTAALRVGVSVSAALEWVRRGTSTDRARRPTGQYVAFAAALEKAKATFESRNVALIGAAAKGGQLVSRRTTTKKDGSTSVEETFTRPEWTASAWLLERSYPDRWGRKDRVDLQVTIQHAAQKVADSLGLTVDEVLDEAQALLRQMDEEA